MAWLCPLLATPSCSVLREDARRTYDPARVLAGRSRAEVEREIGSPDKVEALTPSTTRATYFTTRVSARTRAELAGTNLGVSVFTLGAWELLNPFGIRSDERKQIDVVYDPTGVVLAVTVRCSAHAGFTARRHGTREIDTVADLASFTCSDVPRG